jgi:hypothetical protein
LALATAILPRSASACAPPIFASRSSTSLSMRLTKKLATDATLSTRSPLVARVCSPRMYAPAIRSYASHAKMSVTLTLMPCAMRFSTATIPSGVPGTLIMRLGRSTARQ